MESFAEYRLRADQCRWLAATVTVRDDPAIAALLKLAAEYEAKAVALEPCAGGERQTDARVNDQPSQKQIAPLPDLTPLNLE
jgi:hypothetical protein